MPDFSGVVPRLLEPNRNWILNVKGAGLDLRTAGLLTADTGILLVQAMVNGMETVGSKLGATIDANSDNPVCELMWGSPGTMLASLWLHEWTGQDIWAERFRRDAGLLWNRLEFVEEAGCHLWVQHLYGHNAPHLGAVHGFGGNAFAVIRGWHLLSDSEQSRWAGRLAEFAPPDGAMEDDCATWEQSIGRHRPGRTALLVQHCHGAPGIVNCFARLARPRDRRSSNRRRRTHLAVRATAQRTEPLSRHGGKWLCIPEAFPAHGRAALARSRAPLRHARRRSASARYDEMRPVALPALDRRFWPRRLPFELHRRTDRFPTMDNFFGP